MLSTIGSGTISRTCDSTLGPCVVVQECKRPFQRPDLDLAHFQLDGDRCVEGQFHSPRAIDPPRTRPVHASSVPRTRGELCQLYPQARVTPSLRLSNHLGSVDTALSARRPRCFSETAKSYRQGNTRLNLGAPLLSASTSPARPDSRAGIGCVPPVRSREGTPLFCDQDRCRQPLSAAGFARMPWPRFDDGWDSPRPPCREPEPFSVMSGCPSAAVVSVPQEGIDAASPTADPDCEQGALVPVTIVTEEPVTARTMFTPIAVNELPHMSDTPSQLGSLVHEVGKCLEIVPARDLSFPCPTLDVAEGPPVHWPVPPQYSGNLDGQGRGADDDEGKEKESFSTQSGSMGSASSVSSASSISSARSHATSLGGGSEGVASSPGTSSVDSTSSGSSSRHDSDSCRTCLLADQDFVEDCVVWSVEAASSSDDDSDRCTEVVNDGRTDSTMISPRYPCGEDTVVLADAYCELGNAKFRKGLYREAAEHYSRAKRLLPIAGETRSTFFSGDVCGWFSDKQLDEFSAASSDAESCETLCVDRSPTMATSRAQSCWTLCSSNASLCYLRLGMNWDCVVACDDMLLLDPTNTKAMCRKGIAMRALGDLNGAEAALHQAAGLDSCDPTVQKELAEIAWIRWKDLETLRQASGEPSETQRREANEARDQLRKAASRRLVPPSHRRLGRAAMGG